MSDYSDFSLFRPEVAEARKERLHGNVSLAVPSSWQAIGYLIFAALLAAFLFLATATYSRVESVSGAVVFDKGTASILPSRSGVIAELPVRDGQGVAAGQLLSRIRVEEDMAKGATAPSRILAALDQQDRQLTIQAAMLSIAAAAEKSRLVATTNGLRDEIASLDKQIGDQQRLLGLAKNEHAQVQGVAARGFLSRRDVEAREETLLARHQQYEQLRQARFAKLTSLAETQRASAQSEANARAQVAGLQAERTEVAQQMAQYDSATEYAVASPIAGTVTALTARLGQPAAQGQQLMVIVPSDGRILVELYVPTSAAGFLDKGQEVRLAIDSFPYQQFGTVRARISDIATAAVARQTNAGSMGSVYLVTAELDRASIRAFGRDRTLAIGMTLTARIVTRRQALFEWLFEPLFAVGRR